ncbi:hypothetical protein D3C76_191650 [compost metagenome]
MHHHGEVRARLDRGHPQGTHLLGQARLGLSHPVLHQLLRLVRIRAKTEGDGQGHGAIRGGLAAHVDHPLDPVDGLLERHGHRFGDHLGTGSRVSRPHDHLGWHHLGILGDGQSIDCHQPRQHEQDGDNAGEDGPVDEELRHIHGVTLMQ